MIITVSLITIRHHTMIPFAHSACPQRPLCIWKGGKGFVLHSKVSVNVQGRNNSQGSKQ